MKAILFLSLFFLLTSAAFASDDSFEMHQLKTQKYVEMKDWPGAEGEAKAMTSMDPKNLDGWLMLGIVEQRLEKNDEAASAYKKYLDLNPSADKAETVRKKLAEVEIRDEKAKKEEKAEAQERYGLRSNGLYLAFAPLYKPSTSTVMSGDVSNNYQLGFQFLRMNVGLMYDSGNVSQFKAPKTVGNNTVYSTVGPATLSTYDFYFEFNYILTEPFASTGPFSIYIPVHFGAFENNLKLSDGSESFSNLGCEGALGLGAQWYNRSPIALGLTALYHQGASFADLSDSSGTSTQGIQTTSGDPVHGGNVGFEIRLTMTYLFGYEKTLAEKAGAQ